MIFYLGTHEPSWLGRTQIPLMVSHRRLRDRLTLPHRSGVWVLDSGAFSELQLFGEWRTTEAEYGECVSRYYAGIPGMKWAAPMDWMCEPFMVDRTGLTVEEHQHRTVDNLCRLRQQWPGLPFIPVLQGWTIDDYLSHVAMYERADIDLLAEDTVGLGSVCRRQASQEIINIVDKLLPLPLHGFGVKLKGMRYVGDRLQSTDSMSWSFDARRSPPLPGCTHKNCANCLKYAQRWWMAAVRQLNMTTPRPLPL